LLERLANIERFAVSMPPSGRSQMRGKTMLIRTIETFLRRHEMPATKFGRLAAHDPRFVLDLRMGRTPRPATEARTRAWMKGYEAKAEACQRACPDGAIAASAAITGEFAHAD
jgi:hypothetical protein